MSSYRFAIWSDSVTDATRSVKVERDITLTAMFEQICSIGDVESDVLRLYPNPASTTVTAQTNMPTTLTILDATGRERGRWKVKSGMTSIDIKSLPSGIYFVRSASTGTVRKLIIK